MIKLKFCTVAFGVLLSGFASAASQYPNEPEYDCTAEETKLYIEQVTHNVFAPSPITNPEAFKKAYLEALQKRAEGGDEDGAMCAAIFSDGALSDGWKESVDSVRNVDFGVDFGSMDGAFLQALLDKAKESITKEVLGALETIGGDVCALMSSENLRGMLLDAVNKEYGMNAQNLRLKDFADEITEQQLLEADEDVLLLLSEDKMLSEIGVETKQEMRRMRTEVWDKF